MWLKWCRKRKIYWPFNEIWPRLQLHRKTDVRLPHLLFCSQHAHFIFRFVNNSILCTGLFINIWISWSGWQWIRSRSMECWEWFGNKTPDKTPVYLMAPYTQLSRASPPPGTSFGGQRRKPTWTWGTFETLRRPRTWAQDWIPAREFISSNEFGILENFFLCNLSSVLCFLFYGLYYILKYWFKKMYLQNYKDSAAVLQKHVL